MPGLETEQEEFVIPSSNINFDRAIMSIHQQKENAFFTFMWKYVNSLSVKQISLLEYYIKKVKDNRNS